MVNTVCYHQDEEKWTIFADFYTYCSSLKTNPCDMRCVQFAFCYVYILNCWWPLLACCVQMEGL